MVVTLLWVRLKSALQLLAHGLLARSLITLSLIVLRTQLVTAWAPFAREKQITNVPSLLAGMVGLLEPEPLGKLAPILLVEYFEMANTTKASSYKTPAPTPTAPRPAT